jgi:hypothetical protein
MKTTISWSRAEGKMSRHVVFVTQPTNDQKDIFDEVATPGQKKLKGQYVKMVMEVKKGAQMF